MFRLILELMFFGFSSITLALGVRRHLHSSLVLTKGARMEYSHQISAVPVGITNAPTYSSMEMVVEHQAIMCQTSCLLLVLLKNLCCQTPRRLWFLGEKNKEPTTIAII